MTGRKHATRTLGVMVGCTLLAAFPLALGGQASAAAPASTVAPSPTGGSGLAAALPRVPVVAQGVSSANPAHLVRDRAWDFAQMRRTFNTVSLLPGDPTAVQQASSAGLAVILEFDYKADFFAGKDISAKVLAVVHQIQAAPGTIVAVHIADRINEKYSPQEGLRYLAATGGVLHRDVPGVPVIVNVSDWELTCGRVAQSSCGSHDARFQYETNAVLDQLYRSGYVDGFTVADNLKNNSVDAQVDSWAAARARWPAPFILWSTCSQLSFPDASYPGTAANASSVVAAYMRAPMEGGADGLALWAWHQSYQGGYYSFLNKDGSGNALWTAMAAAADQLGALALPQSRARVSAPAVPPARARSATPAAARTRGSGFDVGIWPVLAFAAIALVLALGTVARLRSRPAEASAHELQQDRPASHRRASLRR